MSAATTESPGAPPRFAKAAPARGEPLVWLTAMGLTAGLLMVIGLLWVIVANGLRVFWPKRIQQFELAEGREFQGGRVLVGELMSRPLKLRGGREYKIYSGNKEVYGLSFHFLDVGAVAEMSEPRDWVKIERLEYGDAIGHPVELTDESGARIASGDETFDERLGEAIARAAKQRREISHIERGQIGSINARMEDLRLAKGRAERGGKAGDAARLDRQIEALQNEYAALADQSGAIRSKLGQFTLSYRVATGEVKQLPVGKILGYYYPNRLGVWERAGLAVSRFWKFLSEEPREANTEGGVFPAIFGTFVMTLLMSVAVVPFGVLAAIYLREYAKQGFFVQAVRIAVNNLAGVPSIVFGVFGLGFFVYAVGGLIDNLFYADRLPTPTFGTGGILWASLTLALMTVPVVIVATEEALAAVPRGMREGSLACGASKWQTIQRIVLPAAIPGILTGLILAMARGAGEVAPLMLVGVVKLAPTLPLDTIAPFFHFERKFMHLGFHIYDLGFQSPDSEAAKPMVFATTFLLIVLVVVLNLAAILIRERIRRKYATGAF
jgi:phosphate transport system permease protein